MITLTLRDLEVPGNNPDRDRGQQKQRVPLPATVTQHLAFPEPCKTSTFRAFQASLP